MSAVLFPELLNSSQICNDAKDRARDFIEQMNVPIGAYSSNAKGYPFIRKIVSEFINHRDNVKDSNPEHVFLTNGAGEAARVMIQLLIRDQNDGVMIPNPVYPLYSALVTMYGGKNIGYMLDEEKNWGICKKDMQDSLNKAKSQGINPRAFVVINPGNPTGHVFSYEDMKTIVEFCYENSLVIVTDELFQHNIYDSNIKFHSVRKVLNDLGEPYASNVELASIYSVSKGYIAECGFRGGYIETKNISQDALDELYKIKGVELCSNSMGQLAVGLGLDPPKEGRESTETVKQYQKERDEIMAGLTERAVMLTKIFNEMKGSSCTNIVAGMNAFPRLRLP